MTEKRTSVSDHRSSTQLLVALVKDGYIDQLQIGPDPAGTVWFYGREYGWECIPGRGGE